MVAQNVVAVLAAVAVLIAPGTAPQNIIHQAGMLAPTRVQREWQHEELTGFIHFGPNTFDDREWGTGKEQPSLFNPSSIDTDQWARTFAQAGFKKVILVTKHHDGFVMWPTRYTKHSVASSSWMAGKGDVVGAFVRSAHKFGLKVGFYLSPADLFQAQPGGAYAIGDKPKPVTIPTLLPGDTRKPSTVFHFVLDRYNTYYLNELYELLTQYGPVEEVWFDGANPLKDSGRVENYDFHDWYAMVRALQPQAIIFPIDINWVGDEAGKARTSQWSVVPLTAPPVADQSTHVVDATSDTLGSDATLADPKTRLLRWMPSECDVPLEGGWFWHPNTPPKTLAQLQAIYFSSVGRNCQLLLDIPPDRSGRFDAADVARMGQFGQWIRTAFGDDLAIGAKASTLRSGDRATFTYTLNGAKTFDTIELRERIEDGQRIASCAVEVLTAHGWRQAASATTVGYQRLLQLATPTKTSAVRVRVLQARGVPELASIGLFRLRRP